MYEVETHDGVVPVYSCLDPGGPRAPLASPAAGGSLGRAHCQGSQSQHVYIESESESRQQNLSLSHFLSLLSKPGISVLLSFNVSF